MTTIDEGSPQRDLRPEQIYALPELLVPELQEHVKQELAPYKYPRRIKFIERLPRTETGKIRRVELRRRELERTTPR